MSSLALVDLGTLVSFRLSRLAHLDVQHALRTTPMAIIPTVMKAFLSFVMLTIWAATNHTTCNTLVSAVSLAGRCGV